MTSAINVRLECPTCRQTGALYFVLMPEDIFQDHGAPICPTHDETLWTDADFTLAADLKKKLVEPINICQFIALGGGMRPSADLLAIMGRHHFQLASCWIKGGRGRLTSNKAKWSIGDAMEAAIEAGYFSEAIIEADFYEAIDETLGGNLQYSVLDAGDAGIYETDARTAGMI